MSCVICRGVNGFKIIQHALDRVTVQVITGPDYQPDSENRIRAVYRDIIGAEVNVEVDYLDEIAPEKSGKRRYVVSHVTVPHS